MRQILLRGWVLCWLTMVWVLLWGSLSAANVIGGLVLALIITLLLPLPAVPVQGRVHPLSLLLLAGYVAYWLVQSSLQLAWLAVRPGPPVQSAVLRERLDVRSDLLLALAVNILNLTPGTVVVEIDLAGRLIYVHVLDVTSERAVRQFRHQVRTLERLLHRAFERESEWRPVVEERAEEGRT